jgi:uncharacterized protein YodC (DUF2158 family)
MESLKVGQIVRLKIGGPIMLVVSAPWVSTGRLHLRDPGAPVVTLTMITCQWFDSGDGLHAGDFIPETLECLD